MQKTEPRYREAELAAIRGVAVTVADGELDEFITNEHTAYLARVIPARLQILTGAGHFAPWQQTEVINRVLLEFLR